MYSDSDNETVSTVESTDVESVSEEIYFGDEMKSLKGNCLGWHVLTYPT